MTSLLFGRQPTYLVTPTGFEPALRPWKGRVLASYETNHLDDGAIIVFFYMEH